MVGKEVVREVGICGGSGGVEEEEDQRSEGVGENSGREKQGQERRRKLGKRTTRRDLGRYEKPKRQAGLRDQTGARRRGSEKGAR